MRTPEDAQLDDSDYRGEWLQAANLSGWQGPLFTAVDVFITAAVIAGGAEGNQRIVRLSALFFDVNDGGE